MPKHFSIRTLLIATFIVALFLALPIRRAVLQKKGREWVESQRGHISYQHPYDYKNKTHSVPYVPNAMISILGIDLFNPIQSVVLDCEELTSIAPLENLTTLEFLAINIYISSDLDFSPLKKLPRLKEIHFTQWAGISREQLKNLKAELPHVDVNSESHPDL